MNGPSERNQYTAFPIETVSENVYHATLQIRNIGQEEADYQHFLMIREKDTAKTVQHP